MFRFILFLGFLVGIAYVMTEPPAPQRALSANEIPVRDDKPLLTSWGPTLGSLRDGVPVEAYGETASTLVASNEAPFGSENTDPTASTDASGPAAVVAAAQLAKPAPNRAETKKPVRATTRLAARNQPMTVEPAIDRIAAALPPQRRGLFGRPLGPQRVQAPRDTRQVQTRQAQAHTVQAAPRNRGLFKRLRARGKQPARAWTLGPTR
ncbi:MAG: hypothetical protein QNJ62_00605 [Methyloceanibacter sp.]|nr:hypothetical protein [Methyloceanibacter sp.]